ncbi:uncharacterized protein LOC106151926 [Lingula anatina]|uniref:Uncharacterized protein LOC106151926 n=1 Tax=Lingula anatina TaxID=7574 RepID=A0A2R2MT01_LINAN|nr:uncharacterized protein LOC106151926 [Lingula anatina]|eukprot:XP_023933147.1 uncharacterized protein LOC106151926 [Lingula anatina]
MGRVCIIYSFDRQKREMRMLTTMEALINDARELFGYGEDENLSVFLESKGARVSTEEIFRAITEETTGTIELMILSQTRGECWSPVKVPSTLTSPSTQTISINQSQNFQIGDTGA